MGLGPIMLEIDGVLPESSAGLNLYLIEGVLPYTYGLNLYLIINTKLTAQQSICELLYKILIKNDWCNAYQIGSKPKMVTSVAIKL